MRSEKKDVVFPLLTLILNRDRLNIPKEKMLEYFSIAKDINPKQYKEIMKKNKAKIRKLRAYP